MTNVTTNHNELLWQRWQKNAENTPDKDAIIFWSIEEEQPFRWTFANLLETAERFAVNLIELWN